MLWVIVPARRGSVGIPNKNLRRLPDGSTCLGRALDMAGRFGGRAVLSTDYPAHELLAAKLSLHDCRRIVQPKLCAEGGGSMMLLAIHALLDVGAAEDDEMLLLQPSSPFRRYDTGVAVLAALGDPEQPTVISGEVIPPHWWPEYAIRPGARLPLRRQNLDGRVYRPCGGYYASSVRQILSGAWGRIHVIPSDPAEILSLDTEDDWREAERRVREARQDAQEGA